MRHSRTIRTTLAGIAVALTLIVAAIPAVHAQQQDIEVTAEVDKAELAVGEELNLKVRITGSLNPRQPVIPNLDGLRPTGLPSVGLETYVIKGNSVSTYTYFYRFVAAEVGRVTIEPISVTIGGQTYRTKPIEVEIFQGLAVPTPVPGQAQPSSENAPSSNGSMFVTASVDDDKPYLGQQITYTFKFYRRAALFPSIGRFGQPRLDPPGFSGFWNGQETDDDEYMETIGPNRYQVVELKTILFPTVVGTLVIEPAGLTVPIDFFEAPNYLETDPIVVEVLPLPPDAPAGFTGAVGKFNISADVDSTDGKVNEPVQLSVRVVGEGNIETLPDPAWPEFQDWRVFESPANSSSRVIDGRLVGTRAYGSVLVPEKAGALTVPEIGYTYYDPSIEEYVEAVTDPIVMTIAEGDGMSPLPPSPGGAAVERAGSDVRQIALVGAVAWRRRQTISESGRAAARRRSAMPDALNALARAGESGADPRIVAADIISDYLSTRLDLQVTGLTHEALDQRLQALGVPLELALQVEGVLGASEVAKYAPEIGDPTAAETHFQRAAQLLNDIDEAIDA